MQLAIAPGGAAAHPATAFFLVIDDGSDPPMMDVLGIKRSEAQHIVDPHRGVEAKENEPATCPNWWSGISTGRKRWRPDQSSIPIWRRRSGCRSRSESTLQTSCSSNVVPNRALSLARMLVKAPVYGSRSVAGPPCECCSR
jgi:hypothetical protein